MTPTQIATLDMVRERFTALGYSPTIAEIAAAQNLSQNGAHRTATFLVEAGYLRRRAGATRGLEPVDVVDLRTVATDRLRAELARRGVTLDALRRAAPMMATGWRARGGVGMCAADTCGATVSYGHVMCRDHWFSLSRDLQEALLNAHSAARRSNSNGDIARYQRLLTKARDVADGLGGAL